MRAVKGVLLAVATLVPAVAAAEPVCDSNLVIVLDRSCSMDQPPSAGVMQTKWELAGAAIQQLTTQYSGKLRFGLIMFPDQTGVSCDQDGPEYVATGAGTEAAVVAALTGTQPSGPCVTNIDTGILQVNMDPAYPATPDPSGRRGFVLLISDGQQSGSCGGTARDPTTTGYITDLYMKGYPTYVVGFGGAVDPDSLNMFAMAGGVPKPGGGDMYYQADDAATLEMALDAIAGDILADPEFGGCTGTPCPDGRCFVPGATCTDGVCVEPIPDAGPNGNGDGGAGNGDGGAGDGDGGTNGANGEDGGCGCQAGGSGDVGGGLALAGFVVAVLARRRRKA